jgi:NTP pyrophosphatase (non-canonical NTP hydrolase)
VEDILDRQGMTHTSEQHGLIIGEEAGEAQRAVLKASQGIRGSREYWHNELRRELAGVILAAAACATHHGVDLEVATATHLAELDALRPGELGAERGPNGTPRTDT